MGMRLVIRSFYVPKGKNKPAYSDCICPVICHNADCSGCGYSRPPMVCVYMRMYCLHHFCKLVGTAVNSLCSADRSIRCLNVSQSRN